MKRHAAFTLLELLLSIAIAAILVSLVVSASSITRTRSEAAKCISNLRQTNLALLQYVADHNGNLLPTTAWSTHASYSIQGGQWLGIRDYLGVKSEYVNVNDKKVKASYMYDTVLTCPTLRRINPNDVVLHRCFSANSFLYQKDPSSKYRDLPLSEIPLYKSAPQKLANVEHPSEMWTFSDASGLKNDAGYAGSYDSVVYAEFLLFPHNKKNHFAFLSGHVEGLTLEEFEQRGATSRFWGKVQ